MVQLVWKRVHANLSIIFSLHTENITAFKYYKLVSNSEGNDSTGLSLRYVPAIGYGKPNPFGNCETHGPAWGVHFMPGYVFWPPIPKSVCSRPCLTYGNDVSLNVLRHAASTAMCGSAISAIPITISIVSHMA